MNPSTEFQQLHGSFIQCIHQLNNFKTFGSFPDCVQIFPSITHSKLNLNPDAMEVYLELGKIKDLLLSKAQRLEFTIFEQKDCITHYHNVST